MVAKACIQIGLCALAALAAASAEAELSRQLLSSRSSAGFSMRSSGATFSGELRDMSGSLLLDRDDLARSKVAVAADLSRISITSPDPMAAFALQGLIKSLPDSLVRFESTSLRKVGERRYQVSGTARVSGHARQVSFPVTLVSAGRYRSEFAAMLGSDLSAELSRALPAFAPLLGRVEAELKLVFEQR